VESYQKTVCSSVPRYIIDGSIGGYNTEFSYETRWRLTNTFYSDWKLVDDEEVERVRSAYRTGCGIFECIYNLKGRAW
jgi:hypothetical protein